MRRNFFGGIEILRQQGGGHHQRRTRVGESFASSTVHGKILRRIERLDPRQITKRVRVFDVRQPPQHNTPWISRTGKGNLNQQALCPSGESLLLDSHN